MIFKDRQEAGQLLAEKLTAYQSKKDAIVLGIPRGGVVVAEKVARVLKLPLDIVITRKIGAPMQPELALGAVDPEGKVVWDDELLKQLGLKIEDLKLKVEEEKAEINRRQSLYRSARGPLTVTGQRVILVDDGVATGATMIAAINYLRSLAVENIVVATPVASSDIAQRLNQLADEVIVLHAPEHLGAVGNFYSNFEPVDDQAVMKLMNTNYGKI